MKKRLKRIALLLIVALLLGGSFFLYNLSKTVRIPILMYHNIDETGDGDVTIAASLFEEQMKAIAENGYTALTFSDLKAYVDGNAGLPDKPVVITFDDGYLSVYNYAYPILNKYGLNGTVFVINTMVGATTYKDTGLWTYPCFTYEQAREMFESGVMDIQSHTYDMHQWAPNEIGDIIREDVLKQENESDEEYFFALQNDFSLSRQLIEENVGNHVFALSYPHGVYSNTSEEVSNSQGFSVTVTTAHGSNLLKQNDPSCLRILNRYAVTDSITPDNLVKLLSRFW